MSSPTFIHLPGVTVDRPPNVPVQVRAASGASPCNRGLARNTLDSRPSVFDGDNVCLNLAVYSPPPEPLTDSFRRKVSCFAEPRGVACLDLVA